MSENDLVLEIAKQVAKDVYEDGLQPAVKEAGGVLGTLFGFINNVVFHPLKKLSMSFAAKTEAFARQLEEKYQNIPKENRCDAPVNILGPALESLKYNIEEEDIKNMFANLIANSMDNRNKNIVHPKYVKIIE